MELMENEKNFESFKLSKVHQTQDVSNNETIKSLQFSNSSNRTGSGMIKVKQGPVHQSSNSLGSSGGNKQQMLQDLNMLVG